MKIAETSRRFDLSADTLRYYERVGLIPTINRTASGIREYTEEDCHWIGFIKCMRAAGLPIEVLIEYVSLFQKGDGTTEARKALLVGQRDLLEAHMVDMQKTLERLDQKIERYEQLVVPVENDLK
jgi:DNA-binding transcriptional MerR regulator